MEKKDKDSENEDTENEDIEIDFGKITNFFKRKKKNVEKAEVKVEEKLEKEEDSLFDMEEKKEEIHEKEEKIEVKIEAEKEKIEVLEEKKHKLEEKEKEIEKAEEDMEEKEDNIELDFSKIKSKVLGLFKKGKKSEKDDDGEEEISIDIKKTAGDIAKFSRKHATLLLILIPIFLSIWFRAYPISLPITDSWAESTVYNSIKGNIATEISGQYPNLPDLQKNELVEKQFKELKKQNNDAIEQQISATSDYFKSRLQDESGHTYLLAIDPYFWYNSARNYLRNGTFGNGYQNGQAWNFKRNGRFGKPVDSTIFNPLMMVIAYKVISIFSSSTTLMSAGFLLPLLFVALSIIPAFFIGKKLAGNVGGVFAGIILAINSALLSRTPAGFADTDAYNVFFPILTAWLLLEAFDAKDLKKKIMLTSITGFVLALFAISWQGWWYVFDFGLVTLGLNIALIAGIHIYKEKKIKKDIIKDHQIKNCLYTIIPYFLSTAVFVTIFRNFAYFMDSMTGPLAFIKIKQVAITTIWPNVMTTVAEFNQISLKNIIGQMGGNLLFSIAIIGIALLVYRQIRKKNTNMFAPILLAIWFIGTTYSFTKGLRFAILMVPAFAVAFGAALGIVYEYASKWSAKELNIKQSIGKPIIILLFCLLLIAPLKSAGNTARNEIPSMNDAWFESLTAVKDNASDAVITSWWDFGHWFVAASERRVTFDGADQGRRIHWVGKSLLTDNENINVGILRMLNCGQEKTFDVLDTYINDGPKSIKILNEIILQDRTIAKKILMFNELSSDEAEEVLELSHCEDLIPQYYIVSDDMIGKAGVWGHFGSWDFEKAAIFNNVKGKKYETAISIMKEKYNLPDDTADTYYYEIQETNADQWVSSWPGYRSGLFGCSVSGNNVKCGDSIQIDLAKKEAVLSVQGSQKSIPHSLVYADSEGVHEKIIDNSTIPVSVVLIPSGNGYNALLTDPLHANSMFTKLFFFNGHGLKHYSLLSYKKSFSGNEIYVYKVDFEPHDKIVMAEFLKKDNEPESVPSTETFTNSSSTASESSNNS